MKEFYFFLTVILLALVSVGVTSCGDDNDEPVNSDIVGTWQVKGVDDDGEAFENLVQFTKNGKWHSVDIYYEYDETDVDVEHGTYTVSGDKVMVTYTDDGHSITETFTYQIKGDKLTLSYEYYPLTVVYTRVKDSVIERYL
ncbi:MAG: lipocalin family protein [Muribaculaceae bacterium]|nr:lipocalin family protein [Muribaculaceae bacterium]